jgi:hypothetical protein
VTEQHDEDKHDNFLNRSHDIQIGPTNGLKKSNNTMRESLCLEKEQQVPVAVRRDSFQENITIDVLENTIEREYSNELNDLSHPAQFTSYGDVCDITEQENGDLDKRLSGNK